MQTARSPLDQDILVVAIGASDDPSAAPDIQSVAPNARVVNGLDAARAVLTAGAVCTLLVDVRGEPSIAELQAFLAGAAAMPRGIRAPVAWLSENLEMLVGVVEEVVPAELAPAELALRLRWFVARHAAGPPPLRIPAPVGSDSGALLGAVANAIAAQPGVLGVRIERSSGVGGVYERGAHVPAIAPADDPSPLGRVLHAPLGQAGGATVTALVREGFHGPLDALLADAHDAIDTAVLVEAQAARAWRFEQLARAHAREAERIRERLVKAAEARDALLLFVAHDIRSPLAVMVGHTQMLAEGILPPERHAESFETLQRQASRISDMATRLADEHRAVLDAHGPSAEATSLPDLVIDAAERLQPRATRRDQRFTVDNAPDPRGGPAGLAEGASPDVGDLVDTLLAIALARAPVGATLRVHTDCTETHTAVSVRVDGGASLPADAAQTARALALASARARERGGELLVAATGDTLRLELPRAAARGFVFVAAANDADVDALTALVGALGGAVSGHPFGAGLLVAARQAHPCVLLVDATRATGRALDALDALRADPRTGGAAVVLLTAASDDPSNPTRGVRGVAASLPAPVDGAAVIAAVANAVAVSGLTRGAGGPGPVSVARLAPLDAVAERLKGLVEVARAARSGLPALVVSEIGPRMVELGHARSQTSALVEWLAEELRLRARPGDLLARLGADAVALVSPGRSRAAMIEISDELSEHLGRVRPRVGASRVAVRARLEVADLVQIGEHHLLSDVVGMRAAGEVGNAS